MKVNTYNKNSASFNGFYNSKILKKGLEFAADNGALFSATTSLVLSTAIRPISILSTPKTDKENKNVACAKSLASSLIGYGIMFAVSKPVSGAFKKINSNPANYLTKDAINNLKNGAQKLSTSKAYIMATQLFKLGIGAVIAAPKAILTALAIPLFLHKSNKEQNKTKDISFTGRSDFIAKGFSKLLNKKGLQEFAIKHQNSNFPMHIMALTDTATTLTFAQQTKKSKKIKEERKKPLIYNALISTGLSIASSYIIDKALDKPTQKFIEKFKQINANSPKLDKYVEGIKIAKPVLIMGVVYYMFIPVISTFISDKLGKKNTKS